MQLRTAFVFVALGTSACATEAASDKDFMLTGGACPVATCSGTACQHFSSQAGEYLVDDGLRTRSAPDTGAPFPPLIQRQIRVGETDAWLRPSIPPQRTTGDGRVGVTQAGTFRAMRLEVLKDHPVMLSPNRLGDQVEGGTSLRLQGPDPAPKAFWNHIPISSAEAGPEVTICEYKKDQPYQCPGSSDDCYDVKVIWHIPVTTLDGHHHLGLESIPATIRVTNPKTTNADVVSVVATASSWTRADLTPFSAFEEALNTRDGHLLVGRVTDINVAGETHSVLPDGTVTDKNFSLAYAYADNPCDVRQWLARSSSGEFTSLRPLAAAPYDTRINGKGPSQLLYGFAAHPFRDASNRVLDQHDVLTGSYPWIDKEARNVLFSTVDVSLFGSTRSGTDTDPQITVFGSRFPTKHTSTNEPLGNTGGSPRNFSVVGNWTEGKIVTLDNMLNNDDFGVFPDDEYEIGLYHSAGHTVAVRVNGGAKLDTGRLRTTRDSEPRSAVANNHHIDSTENMTAMHFMSAAVTPRDVVWTISRGLNSDEVAFDDYIDPHVVLLGEMNAAWRLGGGGVTHGSYLDGFQQDSATHTFTHDPTAIRLQNSATSPVYKLADPGRIEGGGRVEPIAAGGVQGRGLWLESGADASWRFSDTTPGDFGPGGFYAGVFVDARESMQGAKHIFSFRPNTGAPTEVTITDGWQLHVTHGADEVAFDVSCSVQSFAQQWHHVGVLFEANGDVTAFIDGNPMGTATFATPVQLEPGAFVIGGPAVASGATGIRGWYDEARVVVEGTGHQLTQAASVELLCNYARGTTVAERPGAQDYGLAASTPSIAARIASVHAPQAPAGAHAYCATDYAGYTLQNHGYSLGVHQTPAKTTSMRANILLEGTAPLQYDQPRPDSTNRSFCRSCHISEDPDRSDSLTLAALEPNGLASDLDPRTQPSQPSVMPGDAAAKAWGIIPKGWVTTPDGLSLPTTQQSGGVLVLRYLFRGQ